MSPEYFLHLYDNLHRKMPFFGRGIEESLEPISERNFRRPVGHRTIAQLCAHMLVWRHDLIKRLRGEAREKIEIGSPADWPEASSMTKDYFLREFARTKTELQEALATWEYERLNEQLHPDYDYTYLNVLEGGAHHDIYHLGQINLIAALLAEA